MAQQASFVQEGVDRIQSARERLDEEVQRVQKEFQSSRKKVEKELASRRKKVEKELTSRRKSIEKDARKQFTQLRTGIEKNSFVKELQRLQGEASKQVEGAIESLFGNFGVASQADLKRIDRKLNRINKRLKDIERAKSTNGSSAPTAH